MGSYAVERNGADDDLAFCPEKSSCGRDDVGYGLKDWRKGEEEGRREGRREGGEEGRREGKEGGEGGRRRREEGKGERREG